MIVGFEGKFMAEIERHDESNQALPTSEVPAGSAKEATPPAKRRSFRDFVNSIVDTFQPERKAKREIEEKEKQEKKEAAIARAKKQLHITNEAQLNRLAGILKKAEYKMTVFDYLEGEGSRLLWEDMYKQNMPD